MSGSATSFSPPIGKHVSAAADGMKKRSGEAMIKLVPKKLDKRFNHIAARLVIHIPQMFDDCFPANDGIRVKHEQFKQCKFFCREADLLAVACCMPGGGIETDAVF